jgi:hypothetical protein
MSKFYTTLGLLALTLVVLVSSAAAQDQQPRRGGGRRGGAANVPQSFLQTLTEEQRTKIMELNAKYREEFTAIQNKTRLTPEQQTASREARQAAREAGKNAEEQTKAADEAAKLTDEQKKGREELAALRKKVDEDLGKILSADEMKKLQEARAQQQMRGGRGRRGNAA